MSGVTRHLSTASTHCAFAPFSCSPFSRSNAISAGWLCCASPCSNEYWSASAWSRRSEACSSRSCRTRSVFPARAAERTASRPAFHCPYFFTGGDGAGGGFTGGDGFCVLDDVDGFVELLCAAELG